MLNSGNASTCTPSSAARTITASIRSTLYWQSATRSNGEEAATRRMPVLSMDDLQLQRRQRPQLALGLIEVRLHRVGKFQIRLRHRGLRMAMDDRIAGVTLDRHGGINGDRAQERD